MSGKSQGSVPRRLGLGEPTLEAFQMEGEMLNRNVRMTGTRADLSTAGDFVGDPVLELPSKGLPEIPDPQKLRKYIIVPGGKMWGILLCGNS